MPIESDNPFTPDYFGVGNIPDQSSVLENDNPFTPDYFGAPNANSSSPSFAKEMGKAAVRGIGGIGEMGGHLLKLVGAEDTGEALDKASIGLTERWKAAPEYQDPMTLKGGVASGVESTPSSVAAGAPGAVVGGAIGSAMPGVGTAIGAYTGYALSASGAMGLAEYQNYIDEWKAVHPGEDPDITAKALAGVSGAAEAGFEFVSDYLGGKLLFGNALRFGATTIKDILRRPLKTALADYAKITGIETASEVATAGPQAYVRQQGNIETPSVLEAMGGAIIPAATMATLFNLGGIGLKKIRNNNIEKALSSPGVDPEQRLMAVGEVDRIIKDSYPDQAEVISTSWNKYAASMIENSQPIDLNLMLDPLSMDIESLTAEQDPEMVAAVKVVAPNEDQGGVEEEIAQSPTIQTQPEPEIIPESTIPEPTPELPPADLPATPEIVDSGANGEVGVVKTDEQGAENIPVSQTESDTKVRSIEEQLSDEAMEFSDNARKEHIIQLAQDFKKNGAVKVVDGDLQYLVHKSTKVPGEFQVSVIGKDGPIRDFQTPTLKEALDELVNEVLPASRYKRVDLPDGAFIGDFPVGSEYSYEYKYRPMSIGTQPDGYLRGENGGKFGRVIYDRPLTKAELKDFELEPVGYKGPPAEPEPIVESTPTTPDYESEAKSLGLIYKGRMGNVPGKPDMIHFTDPTNAAGSFSLLDGESLPDKLAKEREKKQKGLTPEQVASLGKGVDSGQPKTAGSGKIDLSGMGTAMADNLYAGLFAELQKGSTKFKGIADPVLAAAKPAFDKGLIKSADDLKQWVNNNYTVGASKVAEVDQVSKEPWMMTVTPHEESGRPWKIEVKDVDGKDVGYGLISELGDKQYLMNTVFVNQESRRQGINGVIADKALKEVQKYNGGKLFFDKREATEAGRAFIDSLDKKGLLGENKIIPGHGIAREYIGPKPQPTVAKGTQATKEKIAKIASTTKSKQVDNKPLATTTSNPKAIKETVLSQLEPLIIEARNKWREEIGGAGNKPSDKELDERVLSGKFGDNEAKGKVTISYPGGQYTPNNTLKSLLFLRGKVKSMSTNTPSVSTNISKPSTRPQGRDTNEIFKESEREVMEYETVREGAKNDYEYMVNEALPKAEQRVDEIDEIRSDIESKKRTLVSLKDYVAKDGVKLFGGRVPSSDSLRDMSREADDRVSKIKKEIAEKKKDIIAAYPDMAKEMFPNEKIEKLKFGDIVPYQEFFKSGLRRDQRLFTKKSSDILNGIRKTGEISQADRDWYAKEFGEENTNYDIAYQRLRGGFPLFKEDRNILVDKHGEDWVLTREKRHKTHIKLVRENDKFGTIHPEDQWNGYGDSLSPTVRQQWQSKLEEFENEFRRIEEKNRTGKVASNSGMGGENGISVRRRLRDRRLFNAQVQGANRGDNRKRWEGVSVQPKFGETVEFQLADKHFQALGYQVVPISRVPWGMAVNPETKTVFMGEMSGDRFAYFMAHETSHILANQGNESVLAIKEAVNLDHPYIKQSQEDFGWSDDYTRDEFAASIVGGITVQDGMLNSDQTENLKQAREAAGGGNNIKTNTPEFKKWFGDSKVVDENGKPLVVYHGTTKVGFTEFDTGNFAFFSDRFDIAASFAGRYAEVEVNKDGITADDDQGVYGVFLSMQNPLVVDFNGKDWGDGPSQLKADDYAARAKRNGHDGLIIENVVDVGWLAPGLVDDNGVGTVYAVFSPTQIKSATANVGTYDANNPDIRFGDIIPASIKQSITDLTNKFQSNPQSTVPDEWLRDTLKPFLKETSPTEFRTFEKYFGVPWTNAKKWVKEWGGAVKILLIERPEERARLQHEFSRIAEPFLMLADRMRKAGQSKESIADSQDRLARVIITGDAQLGAHLKELRARYREMKDGPERQIIADKITQIEQDNRYSDEQLLAGIKDDRGKTVKLNQQEIEAYKSVRSSLDFMFDSYMDHLLTQTFRNYKNQKWYSILAQAVGMDLTKEQTMNIVGKGLNKAALLKSKSIQPNIHRIFNRVDQAITETPDNEKMEAGKLYAKLADKMTKEISELRNAISELSGVTDPAQLNKMTKDVFDAYLFTRPATKQIKAMRNQYKKHVAFFPRVREQAKYKLQAVRNVYDTEGNLQEQVKIFSDFFNTESEGRDLYAEILDRFGKDGKIPDDIDVLPPEPATQAPEFAFQGVNDINVQKIFDNAMKEMKIESTFFNEKGEEVNIQNHIQRLGYEAIAKQFQSRGFGRHMIHRQVNVVKGYRETGLEKTLYDYISGMSGIMTKQVAAADYLDHMKTIKDPKQFAALAKYGSDQFRNDTMADRISSKVRSAMFTWYIGGVLRPAILQATQNFVTGIPKHAQYLRANNLGGAGKADIDYIKSMKDMALFAKIGKKYQDWRYEAQDKGKELTLKDKENWLKSHGSRLSAIEADMQAQLLTDGITVDQFIREIKGSIGNRWANGAEKWLDYLAYPFSRMEIFNRQSAALTRFRPAYKLAMAKVGKEIDGEVFSEEDAYNEAFASSRAFVYDTHYPVGKANLPQVAQGPGLGIALKTGYTFKTFTHNFALQTYYDMAAGDWKTWTHSMAYLALFGGLLGLPFFKDLFEFIEKHFGYSPVTAVRQSLRGMGGKTLEQFGMNGLPAMLGMNMSGSLAMGIPFMGEDPSTTLSGVYGGQLKKFGRAFDAYSRGDYYRVASNLAPEFARGPITAAQESQVGKELFGTPGSATTTRGGLVYDKNGKPLSMTGYQAALKSIGFQPEEYSREREMDATIKRQKAWVDGRKSDIAETYRVMKINKDPDAMRDMIRAVRDLNEDIKSRGLTQLVPRATVGKIIQSSRQIKSLQERRQEKYKRAEL